ncbi:hypothetical protein BRARA_H00109 [Brassica rapa]|uniref:RNase H type-1 domain-containing protein n=1 Tax=Brassica campestris TaxID=3711 RepID=A0A397Y6S8_BRACM|nr:hypothetical protein BRARA_H00109 [Brassica rapa]
MPKCWSGIVQRYDDKISQDIEVLRTLNRMQQSSNGSSVGAVCGSSGEQADAKVWVLNREVVVVSRRRHQEHVKRLEPNSSSGLCAGFRICNQTIVDLQRSHAIVSACRWFIMKIREWTPIGSMKTATKAICDAKEWKEAQLKVISLNPIKTTRQIHGTPEVVCRSDAAWKKELDAAGLEWSFLERHNERFASHSKPIAFVISSLVAEGLAIRAAMEHAAILQLENVISESDLLQLIAWIISGHSFSDLHGILSDISLLSLSFNHVPF